jgi:hypothetical protein
MSSRALLIIAAAVLCTAMGCTVSRPITRRSELLDRNNDHPITVLVRDGRTFEFVRYTLADSMLCGTGRVQKGGVCRPFSGEVPLDSIDAIEARSTNILRGAVALGATGLLVSAAKEVTKADRGLHGVEDVRHHSNSYGDGASCPYVYAWDGRQYVLEAEPFGAGLGRALELTTFHLLPTARADSGIVRLRLTNERQETHYVNSLRLSAIELGSAPGAVLDGEGAAWPLVRPQAPLAASDQTGRSILEEVASSDGKMWECDPTTLTRESGYEDVLESTLSHPPGSTTASLVLTGINTSLSTSIFGQLLRAAGDQALALTQAIDTDPELIARLREYLADASLKVSLWNGAEWKEAGAFRPEANAVTFTRGLRISVPADAGETVRIRLRSMADVWKIDAIQADWTPASPLPMRRLDLLSAVDPGGKDLRPLLQSDDDRYAILFPPDRVELRYSSGESAGTRLVYAVSGRGYLREWIPETRGESAAALASMVHPERRIDFIKELLKHRDLVLAPAYQDWIRRSNRESAAR